MLSNWGQEVAQGASSDVRQRPRCLWPLAVKIYLIAGYKQLLIWHKLIPILVLQPNARECDKRSSRRLFELSVFGSVTNADCMWVCVCVSVCEWGDLWVYLLLVWFYELSVKLRQAHAHSYWDRDTQSQHCSAALCYVCWPNCLWWRQSSVNQSVAALGLSLFLCLCLCLSRSLRESHCLPRFLCLLLKHGFGAGAGSGSGPVYVSLVVRMSSSGQLSRCLSVNMPFAFAISQFSL